MSGIKTRDLLEPDGYLIRDPNPASNSNLHMKTLYVMLVSAALLPTAEAGEVVIPTSGKALVEPVVPAKEKSIYDKIWGLATLYENKENPLLQKLALTGRYHGQYYLVDDGESSDDGWDNRRIRVGLKGDFLQQFSFNVQVDLNPDVSPSYTGLTDAYVDWKPSKDFRLRVGKQPVEYTYEGSTSSNEILTIERSLITSTVWPSPEYITGVVASGAVGHWVYAVGGFAGDQEKEFSEFDAGAGILARVGYDFSGSVGLDKALITAGYFYNDGDSGNTAFRKFTNTGSLSLQLAKGRVGVVTDFLAAEGLGSQPDVFGFIVMPYYNITEKLQAVLRYAYASSEGENGLSLTSRYEQKVAAGKGDEHQAVYGGLTYRIYGDKFKVMSGVEYSDMSGGDDGGSFNGWTWVSAVRLSF